MTNNENGFGKGAGIGIGAAAFILAGIRFYIDLQEWKAHGHDYMGLVLSILLFLVTYAVVIAAVWKNLKDAKRAESLRVQIVSIKDDHKTQTDHLNSQHLTQCQEIEAGLAESFKKQTDQQRAGWRQSAAKMMLDIPKATELRLIADGLDDLRHRLEDMLNVAKATGSVPDELEHPLSDIIYKLSTAGAGFPTEIWRFQEDVKSQQTRLRARAQAFLARTLKREFATTKITVPDNRKSSEVLKLLSECSEELRAEADRLWRTCQSDSAAATGGSSAPS